MTPMRRALVQIEQCVSCIQEMVSIKEPLNPKKFDRLFGDLRSIRRSMHKMENTGHRASAKFWAMERRAVVLIVKMSKHLSAS